ncbi:hypothetical protein NE237_003334 [Protea cynaroides]|uniref:Uncharacterized protein n=1 Tax=Protea cynaroides TaxID=273540 RepID=A0A9Q0KGW4_9MAGN|nr:hypothetical protein NE237_003334 [Protea cynaroides]
MSSSPKGEESRLFPSEENKNDGYLGLLTKNRAEDIKRERWTDTRSVGRLSNESQAKRRRMNRSVARSKRNRCWMFKLYDGFEDISPICEVQAWEKPGITFQIQRLCS